ncbi:MAG TPA: aliphatic sulfonate ABC transporter substrate-binding protein [Streptosporangiaceae bacterium]|jgi:sulfonate transport system substrate-binding protein
MTVRVGVHPSNHTLFITSHLPALRAALGDVEWVRYPGGASTVHRIGAGDIDVGGTGSTPPITGQAAGVDLVYLATSAPRPAHGKLVVPRGSSVRTVDDLRGRQVAFGIGSWQTQLLAVLLDRAGLAYDDIEPVPAGPDTYGRFTAGRIDAWVAPNPPLDRLVRDLGARVVAETTDYISNPSVFFADRAFATEHRAEVAHVLAGLHAADLWIATHPDEAAAVYSEHAPAGATFEEWAGALLARPWGLRTPDAEFLAEQQRAADVFHRFGIIAEPVTVADATLADPVPVPDAEPSGGADEPARSF